MLDRAAFRTWTGTILTDPDPEARLAATGEVATYLAELLERKRLAPGQDLMSALIRTTDEEGDRLSAEELRGTAWLLLVAGHETTVNLISNGVLALLTHADQVAALREDMTLMDNAVEEMLRYDGPVETPTFRFTTEPVEIGNTVIPGGGELVLVALADANHDPARFPDPGRFDVRQPPWSCRLRPRHPLLPGRAARPHGGSDRDPCSAGALPDLALDAHPAALTWRNGMLIRGPRRAAGPVEVLTSRLPNTSSVLVRLHACTRRGCRIASGLRCPCPNTSSMQVQAGLGVLAIVAAVRALARLAVCRHGDRSCC